MPKSKATWVTVPNTSVRHIFVCDSEGCKQRATVNTRKLIQNDVPECPECDVPMSLDVTQILVTKDKTGYSVQL